MISNFRKNRAESTDTKKYSKKENGKQVKQQHTLSEKEQLRKEMEAKTQEEKEKFSDKKENNGIQVKFSFLPGPINIIKKHETYEESKAAYNEVKTEFPNIPIYTEKELDNIFALDDGLALEKVMLDIYKIKSSFGGHVTKTETLSWII